MISEQLSLISVALYFKLKTISFKNLYLGRVNFEMFCEILPVFISFAAFVAVERPLFRVRSHVALQMPRRSTSEVALATLVWLFSCVLSHHVNFQIASFSTGILTHCASVKLFPRVSPFVLLQMT